MSDFALQQVSILIPAFLAGVLVISTHVPLGQEVFKRGIIFLDLAIAQIAVFGVIFAKWLNTMTATEHSHAGHSGIQVSAILSAIVGGSLLYWVRGASIRVQEALIGVLFILAATGSVLLLSNDPHGGEYLKDVLVGQILWVEYSYLVGVAVLYAVILLLWFCFRSVIDNYGFYVLFAITITVSTQLVGIYLVFASLIVPALAVYEFKKQLIPAYLIGIFGYLFGLLLSYLLDLPSGAMIVWVLVLCAIFVHYLCKYSGLFNK